MVFWIAGGVLGLAVLVLWLMATVTPEDIDEELHRSGKKKIPGPGGLYNVTPDSELRDAWREFHPGENPPRGPYFQDDDKKTKGDSSRG